MLLKKQTTNKLFYKKYPYKISCNLRGVWVLRSFGLAAVKEYCKTGEIKKNVYWDTQIDRKSFSDFLMVLEPLLNDLKIRIEHSFLDIYIDNRTLYNTLLQSLEPWLRSAWEPANDEELEFLLKQQNSKKIVCKELPYKKYQYKVHLRYRTDIETRNRFFSWMLNYGNKIYAPGKTQGWLQYDNRWAWSPFLYVEDLGTLSMVCLFLSGAVVRVEEFIPKRSINTTL